MTAGGHPKLDVLAVGAHPDDVELACGGTLALMASRGRQVGIVHLTRGESGTRGSAEERRREATAAARALGAATLDLLDCGDGELRAGRAEEDALIRLLRRYRPEVVLAPPTRDRHPDHGRAHALVAAAAFYAGLAGRRLDGADADLAPHRPAAVFHYMQHDSFDPAFVVDVTTAWEAKKAALACYGSQLQVPADWGGWRWRWRRRWRRRGRRGQPRRADHQGGDAGVQPRDGGAHAPLRPAGRRRPRRAVRLHPAAGGGRPARRAAGRRAMTAVEEAPARRALRGATRSTR